MARVQFDPLVQFPELGALRSAVLSGAWEPVAGYLEAWRGRDPQRVHVAAWTVVETDGAEQYLARHEPSRLVRTLTAMLHIHQAWLVRGTGWASSVTDEQWAGFRRHLVQAEQELIELAALDPEDDLVAGVRLVSCRGLSLGLSEAQRRYARVVAVSPDNIAAQSAQLQTLAPKWAGTTELMFEFAREAVRTGRPGSSAGRLVAMAHYEHWLGLPQQESGEYSASEVVHEEIAAAAEASVFHPDYEPGLRWITDHSYFACLHSLGGRHDLARRHFEALGDNADLDAWRYLGDSQAEHDADRANALAAGARS